MLEGLLPELDASEAELTRLIQVINGCEYPSNAEQVLTLASADLHFEEALGIEEQEEHHEKQQGRGQGHDFDLGRVDADEHRVVVGLAVVLAHLEQKGPCARSDRGRDQRRGQQVLKSLDDGEELQYDGAPALLVSRHFRDMIRSLPPVCIYKL